jgi:hypothetical protein
VEKESQLQSEHFHLKFNSLGIVDKISIDKLPKALIMQLNWQARKKKKRKRESTAGDKVHS